MTQPDYMSSPIEGWQDFVAWDGDDLFDPMFDGDTGLLGLQGNRFPQDYHLSESVTSEQPYLVSAPPSVIDEPPSLAFTVSAPPSILDGSSSYGQVYGTSPLLDVHNTSPLVGSGDARYFGSFDACENNIATSSYRQESPILDTRYDRIVESPVGSLGTSPGTVFNPYLAGSSHSFSGLDVRASQVLNAGTWVDHPQIIEPIAEGDELSTGAVPIAISHHNPQSFNGSFTSCPSPGTQEHYSRSRAVTIPQSIRHPASYNQRVAPALSVSPVARRPRSATLSRSNSRTESRRKLGSSSPTTDNFGWVSYHLNTHTNRLAPTSTDGLQGRVLRGRKKGLTAEQRAQAALMRIIGACSNCQRRKEKCDPGTPCKSCLEHYKGDLVNHPCRDRVLSDLSSAFLSDRLGWHPTARSLDSFIAPNNFNVADGITYTIPLQFGFGPTLLVPVHALHVENGQTLYHDHTVYSWPPESSSGSLHTHAVLPAVISGTAMSNMMQTLDNHLSVLVMHHFRAFPLYMSPLRILREVYVYFRSLPTSSPHFWALRQALKLLVLVHIGGDITLSTESNPVLNQLMRDTMDTPGDISPSPCYIRSQFGSIMPGLALNLMKEVLASLEQLLLNRDCDDWPVTLAVLITILMTIESIHYHAAKAPYHSSFDPAHTVNAEEDLRFDDQGVKTLLDFYRACFLGCHSRLRPDWEGESSSTQNLGIASPHDIFIESVRGAIKKATSAGYLSQKATENRDGNDMEYFFDRLVARLLLLKS